MGMSENWDRFIAITKSKSKSHMQAAQYWDRMHTFISLSMIILGATTTFLSLISSIPGFVISALAALATLISAISAFMRPHDRRQLQVDSAKEFKVLMMKMVRCEKEKEYEDLWRELNKAMMDEPFLPKKYVKDNPEMDWTKTPELQIVIAEKEQELEEVLGSDHGDDDVTVNMNGKQNMDDGVDVHYNNLDDKALNTQPFSDDDGSHKELIEMAPQ